MLIKLQRRLKVSVFHDFSHVCVPLQRSFYNLGFVVSIPSVSVCGLLQHYFCVARRVFHTAMTATIGHFTYIIRGQGKKIFYWLTLRQRYDHSKILNSHFTTMAKMINHSHCIQTISILL